MVKYPDVSLLLQGPLTQDWPNGAGKHIEALQEMFGEVILSTWTEHIRWADLFNLDLDKIKLVHQYSDIDPALDLQYNIGRQALTILKGLRSVTKPYVLKHRTDENFSNLDVLVDKFYEHGCKKWVCAPVVFLPPSQYRFHAADHLFIAEREKLIKAFERVIGNLFHGTYEKNLNGEPAAEIEFTSSYLDVACNIYLTKMFHNNIMREHFDIVPLESLMPFSIKIGTKGFNFTTPEQVYDDMPFLRGVKTIEDILSR